MVARDALVPRVAREDDVPLVRATSLRETLQNTAQFVGPLAAGLERQRLGHDQPLTAASALADVRQGFRFIVSEPLLGPLTWLLVAWVAVYVPLSTLIFPAWFNFARESAGALGLFLGVQALGGVLGGLGFAAVGPKVSQFRWFVATEVVATALLAALLASGWLVNATAPETAITLVVAANAVMVAAFAWSRPCAWSTPRPRLGNGERLGAVVQDGHGVLEVGRAGAVAGGHGPAVGAVEVGRVAVDEHRLDGQGEAVAQARAPAGAAVVVDRRVLVEELADAVAAVVGQDAVAGSVGDLADGVADVGQPVAHPGLGDPGPQGPLGRLQQARRGRVDLANGHGHGGVGVVAVDHRAAVDREHVPGPQAGAVGDAVDDHLVDRQAQAGRERGGGEPGVVAEERGRRPLPGDGPGPELVQLPQADPGLDRGHHPLQGPGHHPAGPAHGGDLVPGLQDDHSRDEI